LREGKGTTFEGGVRVPCIMRWPGRIPEGSVCAEPLMTIDLLPTLAKFIGAELPTRSIDGRAANDLLLGVPGATSPQEAYYFYYHRNHLESMRAGRWKLHFPHGYRSMEGRTPGSGGTPGKYDYDVTTGLELYDLIDDIGETTNVAQSHPLVMARLLKMADAKRRDLGDELTKTQSTGQREPGRMPEPKPIAIDTMTKRPNIVFIFADDHAYQAIGAYGSVINTTPNLDRLASEGMLFRNCFVTNSICGPSRAVVLTGKYSHLNGFLQNGNRFDGAQQTIPKLLQKGGYQTSIVGKWHLGSDPTGFDYWNVLIGQGPYYNPPMIENGTRREHVGYTTDLITDLTLDWLKNQRDEDKPFLLMFQHKAPHRNWQPSPKHLTMYDNVEIPEPATLFDDLATRGTAAKTSDMSIEKTLTDFDLKFDPPGNLTEEQLALWNEAYEPKNEDFLAMNLEGKDLVRWKYQRYIKDYLRCVASLDDNVGRLLDYLDDSGLAENTIVIYSSDQGFYLGEHGWFDKRWMYEESLRMPLIVRWPGVVEPGSESDLMVSNLDFGETFLDVAGLEIPDDMQGRSLVLLLKGETPDDWRDAFYYHYYEFPGSHDVRKHYGVRDPRYKLIHFYTLNEWELYDLESDPRELNNVYGDAKYTHIVDQLKQEILQQRERLGVPDDAVSSPTQ
ncbi:MAG: sulfatase-like hydrolase/transferase, partial [Planctomycetota bacterium]|nr:sulfatase-like hydrolase/transferase [Planctomycetota bacterium]